MFNTMRDYLAFSGLQYQKPEKAGQDAEKMHYLRSKGQEARKAFTELAKAFQARHPEWILQGTSQWMNQAQRLRPHFWAYLQREGEVTEPMLALRLYGSPSDFGVSLEVSFRSPLTEVLYFIHAHIFKTRKVEKGIKKH